MSQLSEANEAVLDLIRTERMLQDKLWGEQNHPDLYWLGILMEEVGEVARAVIEGWAWAKDRDKELIQVAAVAVAWKEAIDRRNAPPTPKKEEPHEREGRKVPAKEG